MTSIALVSISSQRKSEASSKLREIIVGLLVGRQDGNQTSDCGFDAILDKEFSIASI